MNEQQQSSTAAPKFIKICGAKALMEEIHPVPAILSGSQLFHTGGFYPNNGHAGNGAGLLMNSGSLTWMQTLPNHTINVNSCSFIGSNGQVSQRSNASQYFQPIKSVTVKLGS